MIKTGFRAYEKTECSSLVLYSQRRALIATWCS